MPEVSRPGLTLRYLDCKSRERHDPVTLQLHDVPGRGEPSLGPPGLPLPSLHTLLLLDTYQSMRGSVVDTLKGCLSLLQPALSTDGAPFPSPQKMLRAS